MAIPWIPWICFVFLTKYLAVLVKKQTFSLNKLEKKKFYEIEWTYRNSVLTFKWSKSWDHLVQCSNTMNTINWLSIVDKILSSFSKKTFFPKWIRGKKVLWDWAEISKFCFGFEMKLEFWSFSTVRQYRILL
jgi:hypothetical protein